MVTGHRNSLFHLFFDPKYTGTDWFVGDSDATNISLIAAYIDAVIRDSIPNIYTQATLEQARDTKTIKTSEYTDSGIAASIDFGVINDMWTKRGAEQPEITRGFKIAFRMRFALSDTYTTGDYIKAEAFHPKLDQACRNAAARLIDGISAICTTPKQSVIMSHCAVKITDDLKSHSLSAYNVIYSRVRDLEMGVTQAAIASESAQQAIVDITEDRTVEDITERTVESARSVGYTKETTDKVSVAISTTRDAIDKANTLKDLDAAWITHTSHLNSQDEDFATAYAFASDLLLLEDLKAAKIEAINSAEKKRKMEELLKEQTQSLRRSTRNRKAKKQVDA